uniref:Olfactomedin-like domain-containing protein n=2 Tax=Leptobrachium leishanense TaxID=445787 RepID=A0A8C5QHY6_9ANUR
MEGEDTGGQRRKQRDQRRKQRDQRRKQRDQRRKQRDQRRKQRDQRRKQSDQRRKQRDQRRKQRDQRRKQRDQRRKQRDQRPELQRHMMIVFLILMLGSAQSQFSGEELNSTGSVDEDGVCYCTVILPDTTFPYDRFEHLEISNRNLSISVEQQIIKIHSYELIVTVYLEKLKNLTVRVEKLENGELSYTKLDFELLKLEIAEIEALIVQLKASLNGTNVIVETLYAEIRNISILVHQMESYDKNNVLVIRREILALQKRLEDCQTHANTSRPPPPVEYGTCKHGGIMNISKPYLVQQNFFGASYLKGSWGKDSVMGGGRGAYFLAPLQSDGRMGMNLRGYASHSNLLLYKAASDTTALCWSSDTTRCGQGTGMILYNLHMYYNCYNSRNICRNRYVDGALARMTLTNAAFNNRFSYALSSYEDIDMEGDEYGLWVIYSNEENFGNFIISKMNDTTFTVTETWTTSQYKPAATNAFMVCGVLFATRALNTQTEEIFYSFDTKTGKESSLSIPFEKPWESFQGLSYNPNDHKLYAYSNSYLITYDVTFQPVSA